MVDIHDRQVIIWDLDGTLIDSFDVFLSILKDVVTRHDLPMPSKQSLKQNYHGSLVDSLKNILSITDQRQLDQILDDFIEIQFGYYEHPDEHLFHDAVDLASRAHEADVRQVIVTNRQHERRGPASPRYIVEHSVLHNYIDDIVSADSTSYAKPDARVVQEILKTYKATPEQVVVVGDQHVDAALAHNLDALAVLVSRDNTVIPYLELLAERQHEVVLVQSLREVRL